MLRSSVIVRGCRIPSDCIRSPASSFRGYTPCIHNMLTYINNKERRQPPASVPLRARPSWPSSYSLSLLHPTYFSAISLAACTQPGCTQLTPLILQHIFGAHTAVQYRSTVRSCMLPLNIPYIRARSLAPSPSPYAPQRSPRSCVVTSQVLAHTICAYADLLSLVADQTELIFHRRH